MSSTQSKPPRGWHRQRDPRALGVHQKSGERYPFIDVHGQAVAATLLGQVSHAAGIERVDILREVQYRPWLRHEIEVRREQPCT